MRFDGRSKRQQPWWLFVAVLAYALVFTVSSAAPVGSKDRVDGVITPPPTQNPFKPNLNRNDDSPPIQATTTPLQSFDRAQIDRSPMYRIRQSIAKLRQNVQRGQQWWTSTMSPRIASARDRFSARVHNFRLQRHENQRLRQIGPQRGEVEIHPFYEYSEQERSRLEIPQDIRPKLTTAEAVAVLESLTQRQKELYYLLGQKKPTPEQLKRIKRLIQEGMAAGTEAKAAAERATRGAESELKPGIAGLSGARTLARTPSSDWDYKYMLTQAGRSAEQGAEKVINALHVPRSALHLGKRSPEWTNHPHVQYPGEGFLVMKSPDQSLVLFRHFTSNADSTTMASTFDELTPEHQKLVLKTVPNVRNLRKHGWNPEKTKPKFPISSHIRDTTGLYYFRDRRPQRISVRSKGSRFEFEYLKNGVFRSSTKWASFRDLPSYIRSYLEQYTRGATGVPWASIARAPRKRSLLSTSSGSGYDRVGSSNDIHIHYPGKQFNLYDSLKGHLFSFPDAARSDNRVILKPYQRLTAEELHLVESTIPMYPQYADGRMSPEDAGIHFTVSNDMRVAHVQIRGQEAETIRVTTSKGWLSRKYIFHRSGVDLSRSSGLSTSFSKLPTHLRSYIQENHPDLIEQMKKTKLRKRAPYPGEKLTITRSFDGSFVFNFLKLDGSGIKQSKKWSQLPREVKEPLTRIPFMTRLAESKDITAEQARQYQIPVVDDIRDQSRAFFNPEKQGQAIQVWQHHDGRLEFEYQHTDGTFGRVPHSQLPSHLHDYVEEDPEIRSILLEAAGSSRGFRLRKRASKGEGSEPGEKQIFPGEGVIIKKSNRGYTFREFKAGQRTDAGFFTLWQGLTPDEQGRIRRAIPLIEGVVGNRVYPKDSDISLEIPGARDDGKSAHYYPDRKPEKIIVTRENGVLQYTRMHPGEGGRTIAASSFQNLPAHL